MTDNGVDGGRLPSQAIAVGGKGADGKFRYMLVGNDGAPAPASGGATSAKQDTQITAEQAILAAAGATTGAAVITDANGTIQQYLRGLVKLAITAGSWLVSTSPRQYAGVPSSFAILTADGTVFTLAAGEVGFIQNLDDVALAVKKGASASTTSMTYLLPACTAASAGDGGAVRIDDWIGAVSVAAMSGTASYLAHKIA